MDAKPYSKYNDVDSEVNQQSCQDVICSESVIAKGREYCFTILFQSNKTNLKRWGTSANFARFVSCWFGTYIHWNSVVLFCVSSFCEVSWMDLYFTSRQICELHAATEGKEKYVNLAKGTSGNKTANLEGSHGKYEIHLNVSSLFECFFNFGLTVWVATLQPFL